MIVLRAGLGLAAVASLAEGEVEVVADEAHPVSLPALGGSAGDLEVGDILDRGQVVHI